MKYILLLLLFPTLTFGQIIISGDALIIGSGNANLFLHGNITNNYTGASAYDGFYSSGKVFFQGNTTQSIGGSATSLFIHNFEMNNPTGLSIGISTMYIYNLHFSSGKITHTGVLFIEDGGNTTGANSNTYVIGSVTKYGNDNFVFPIGNDTIYAPIEVANVSGNPSLKASYNRAIPPNNTNIPLNIVKISDLEYWNLDKTGTSSPTADVILHWEDSKRSAIGSDLNNLYFTHYDASTSTWDYADSGTKTGSGSLTSSNSGTITKTGINSFGKFTFGSDDAINNPLPIELLYFNTFKDEQNVKLEWATASEFNNNFFIIEKSKDAISWEKFDEINGAGNSNMPTYYYTEDLEPYNNISYYRLSQVDIDGTIKKLETRSVDFSQNNENDFIIYPNPTSNYLNIKGANIENIKIFNSLGQNIYFRAKDYGDNIITINISDLPNGVFYVKNKDKIKKIIKK